MFSFTGSDPETSFSLTSSEFKTVVEALATDEQKFIRFVSLLDLGKMLQLAMISH